MTKLTDIHCPGCGAPANFNIMPAALLETKGKYAIIKSQIPVALAMLVVHILLMYFWAF